MAHGSSMFERLKRPRRAWTPWAGSLKNIWTPVWRAQIFWDAQATREVRSTYTGRQESWMVTTIQSAWQRRAEARVGRGRGRELYPPKYPNTHYARAVGVDTVTPTFPLYDLWPASPSEATNLAPCARSIKINNITTGVLILICIINVSECSTNRSQ